jgi:hypothetical protein
MEQKPKDASMKKHMGRLVVCLVALLAGAGCEEHTVGGRFVGEIEGEGGGRSYAALDVGGTWTGKAGTGQGRTVLRLSQDGNSLYGSWTWGSGDTRSCGGHRDGRTIYLWDNSASGDSWILTLSDDGAAMSGSAKKHGGGSYALSFNR